MQLIERLKEERLEKLTESGRLIVIGVAGDDDVERGMDWTVHVGIIQGAVTHAVYRLRPLSSTQHRWRLADHGQYGHRCHLLCSLRRTYNHPHSVIRHFQETLPGKGRPIYYEVTTIRSNNIWSMALFLLSLGFTNFDNYYPVIAGISFNSWLRSVSVCFPLFVCSHISTRKLLYRKDYRAMRRQK